MGKYADFYHDAHDEVARERGPAMSARHEAALKAHNLGLLIQNSISEQLISDGMQPTVTSPPRISNPSRRVFTLSVPNAYNLRFELKITVELGIGYSLPVHDMNLTARVENKHGTVPVNVPANLTLQGEFRWNAEAFARYVQDAVRTLARMG
jgi:hypothetical protein